MPFSVRVEEDSLSIAGSRLTTFVVTYPRIIHAEVMTHRVFARNAASSRAIPVRKLIQSVVDDPYVPGEWGSNKKGMQAGDVLTDGYAASAEATWLIARDAAVTYAKDLAGLGVHKQLANRLLEPFQWYTVVITATEWSNFFNLRCHEDAHPEIQRLATEMREQYRNNLPSAATLDKQHLPFVSAQERELYTTENLALISSARCARVSYLTHDGKRDVSADLALATRLLSAGHMSPFEHTAIPNTKPWVFVGCLRGWSSYRSTIANEGNILEGRKA